MGEREASREVEVELREATREVGNREGVRMAMVERAVEGTEGD